LADRLGKGNHIIHTKHGFSPIVDQMMTPIKIAICWMAVALVVPMATAPPALASEAWNCIKIIKNKSYPHGYRVDGDRLLHSDGTFSSTIIENNSDHIISYYSFLSKTTRYPDNSAPVRVSEPMVGFIIIEKRSGRLTLLSNDTMSVLADQYGTLPPPEIDTEQCTPN
jgi:hypothetical protein